jgi:hypothetical protein
VRNLFTNPFDKEVEPVLFCNYTRNEVAAKQCKASIDSKKGSLVGLHLFHESGRGEIFR